MQGKRKYSTPQLSVNQQNEIKLRKIQLLNQTQTTSTTNYLPTLNLLKGLKT